MMNIEHPTPNNQQEIFFGSTFDIGYSVLDIESKKTMMNIEHPTPNNQQEIFFGSTFDIGYSVLDIVNKKTIMNIKLSTPIRYFLLALAIQGAGEIVTLRI